MKITLAKYDPAPNTKMVSVETPSLPRVGDHVSHEPSGMSGYVKRVSFWWDEKAKKPDALPTDIEVFLE